MDAPCRRRVIPVTTKPKNPKKPPKLAFETKIITFLRVLFVKPPFRCDPLRPLGSGDNVHDMSPAEFLRRPIGNERCKSLNRLRAAQKPQGAIGMWQELQNFAALRLPILCRNRWKEDFGTFRNMALPMLIDLETTCAEPAQKPCR